MRISPSSICIIAIYGVPSSSYRLFTNELDDTIKKFHKFSLKFIIFGNININYLLDNDSKK
jgi:hypothetical protein